jgi:hypothetical protein
MHRNARWIGVAALAVLTALSGCGSDDDDTSTGGGGSGGGGGGGTGGGTLTLSSAIPASENTTIDVSKAATSGNDARAADSFSAQPYCDVYFEAAPGANGRTYAVQVYFRQSDQAVLNVSVVSSATPTAPPGYVVFDNDGGKPITGVTADKAARTITFDNKVLAGSAGEAGTLSGTASFPANSTNVAGCGV